MSNGSTSIDKWLVSLFMSLSIIVTAAGSAAANS